MKILLFIFLTLPSSGAGPGLSVAPGMTEIGTATNATRIGLTATEDCLASNETGTTCTNSDQSSVTGKPYQVIINEIMSDPVPAILLPEVEYIELFNRSEAAVNISGWRLVFGNRIKVLDSMLMQPGAYLIVCDASQEAQLKPFGTTLPVEGMPAIVNGGQSLTLKNSAGAVIHTVTFSNTWFDSPYKKEGGYSLELIDPDNPCGSIGNWKETADHRGGSPGSQNAVRGFNRDAESPVLLRSVPESTSSVRLIFSENMDSASLNHPGFYSAGNNILQPLFLTFDRPDYTSAILHFADSFLQGRNYRIMVLDSLRDCAGNRIEKNAMVDFALPADADSLDVVFNEVLFHASQERGEFIELHNRSLKTVNLSDFVLALADPFTGAPAKMTSLSAHPFLIFPGGYVALTAKLGNLPAESRNRWLRCAVEVPDLFALNDAGGSLILYDRLYHCIDRFTYSEGMHAGLLSGTEGVSLERIAAWAPTSDAGNWTSAAASQGFATPGCENSQMIDDRADNDREIQVIPEAFSPDNDGIDDCLTIRFNLSEPGYLTSIFVFDNRGSRITTLASNLSLGTECLIVWNGLDAAGVVPPTGMYLLYIELFHPQGGQRIVRKVITLAKKLY